MTLGPEDDASASFLDEWLARDYSALGYSVVRVAVLPTQKRLAFVLESLCCSFTAFRAGLRMTG
jgi:hypothetical protein